MKFKKVTGYGKRVYNDFNFPAVGMVTDFFARDITKLYNTQVQMSITI